MSSKDIVRKRLIFVWRNALRNAQNLDETMSKPHKAFITSKASFFLSREGILAFNQIIDELKKVEGVTLKFSDKYLEKIVNKAIVELVRIEEKEIQRATQKQVDDIFENLATQPVDWTITVPIANLKIEMEEFQIGKVRLFRFKNDDKKRLQSKIEEIYKRLRSKWTNLQREGSSKLTSLLDITLEKFVGKVCAEVIVLAVDHQLAEEIGIQAIEIALDALRFYRLNYSFRDPFYTKNYFDIQGNIHSSQQTLVLFSSTEITFPRKITGFMTPFNMTKTAMNNIKNDGFDIVSGILGKNEKDRTAFEKDLVTSIRFCALSTRDEPITTAFVNSIISLEALLLDEREAIIDNLAERVAFIIGKNSDERNWFFDQVKRLYRIRCSIVHSGNTDIQRSDLTLIQKLINYGCITNLLKSYKSQNINSITHLIKWIRNQKFKDLPPVSLP